VIYHVEYLKSVQKTLEKMDKYTKRILFEWIDKNLEGCQDPRVHGKPLSANRTGQWRYRVGDYRIIANIQDNKLVILVIAVGHRREIYK
jgi:mRNA interferase RelE/StbE